MRIDVDLVIDLLAKVGGVFSQEARNVGNRYGVRTERVIACGADQNKITDPLVVITAVLRH